MGPSSEPRSRVKVFHSWERFWCTSIFSSPPSMSMLCHNEYVGLLKHNSLILPLILGELHMPLILDTLVHFFSRWTLMLSEHLTISECWNLRFPMNSECQFSPWSTGPIGQSSTHWQLGWLTAIQLDFPLLQLLERVGENGVWDVIALRTKLWHRQWSKQLSLFQELNCVWTRSREW